MVGGVGQRVLAGAAKRTAGLFFSAIDRQITGAPAPAAALPATTATAAAVSPTSTAEGERAAPSLLPATGQRASAVLVAVAAAVGAAAALAGVLIGARIGRRG